MFIPDTAFNVLYTKDIVRTHTFYKAIGAEIKELEKDKVVVSLGSFELHFIHYLSEPYDEYKYIAQPENYGHGVIFYIETDTIEDLQVLVQKAEGVIKKPISPNHWGCWEFLFEDSNGYKFAAYQGM